MTTRRAFVGDATRALAGLAMVGRLPASVRWLPTAALRRGASANTLFAAEGTVVDLHKLAASALEAAQRAGAAFADIRLAEFSRLYVGSGGGNVAFTSSFSYGIRVCARGAWAFIYGEVPEEDRVATVAREAVATAQGYATMSVAGFDLAPAPAVQGEWTTPIHTDPFTVPIEDQGDVLRSYADMALRAPGGASSGWISAFFDWRKEYRVYGSTENSRTTQTIYQSLPRLSIRGARTYFSGVTSVLPRLGLETVGGYETILDPAIPDQLKRASETTVELSQMPERRIDVGRYPVVFDGALLGTIFHQSVGRALELDRALGYESDASGTSFLAPPTDVLGKQMIHPLLHVTADRSPPHLSAVKWDDDGVETTTYPLLQDGIVVNYHTSRQTAPALSGWYQANGRFPGSRGCAVSGMASDPVTVQSPHLNIAPAAAATSFEDLYREMTHGLIIRGTEDPHLTLDQQLASGELSNVQMFEVVRGKIVGRVKDAGVEFQTLPFWKSLTALGGTGTLADNTAQVSKGVPWKRQYCTTTAPAGLVAAVNIHDTGLRV